LFGQGKFSFAETEANDEAFLLLTCVLRTESCLA
jgi:hypothetical protein